MKPKASDLLAVVGRSIPDVLAPNLRILFCGINPGLYSAYTGHHFARPGNRFWPALYAAGFTERLLNPAEQGTLLGLGYGITNLVNQATASAAEVTKEQLIAGGGKLRSKARRYQPQVVAILGISAYRIAFEQDPVQIGPQRESLGSAELWVLPNPSGLNAHYTPTRLAAVFRSLRLHIERPEGKNGS